MTDQSIFGKDDQQQSSNGEAATPAVAPDNSSEPKGFDHLLSAIRNEQGEVKYSTVEDALTGAAHAQELISKNKGELTQLRSELQSLREENAEYKGAVSAMQTLNQPSQPEPTSSPANDNSGADEVNHEELIEKLLVKKEQEKLQAANTEAVAKALQEKFGEKAAEQFYGKAAELGLDKEQMNKLAAQSPKAVLSYFDSVKADNINPTQTSGSTESLGEAPSVDPNAPLPKPETSILLGASADELKAEMQRHKEHVYKKYGVSQ